MLSVLDAAICLSNKGMTFIVQNAAMLKIAKWHRIMEKNRYSRKGEISSENYCAKQIGKRT
jgi:hypothetical protein